MASHLGLVSKNFIYDKLYTGMKVKLVTDRQTMDMPIMIAQTHIAIASDTDKIDKKKPWQKSEYVLKYLKKTHINLCKMEIWQSCKGILTDEL